MSCSQGGSHALALECPVTDGYCMCDAGLGHTGQQCLNLLLAVHRALACVSTPFLGSVSSLFLTPRLLQSLLEQPEVLLVPQIQ